MTVHDLKNVNYSNPSHEGFQRDIDSHCSNSYKQLKKIVRTYIFFHLSFIGLLIAEIIAFSFFLTFLSSSSSLVPLSIAGIVLTGFTYLILLFYFQTKKPEQFLQLRNYFMLVCKKGLPKNIDQAEYHLSLAHAAYRFANRIKHDDSKAKEGSGVINHLIRKFSTLCHKKDLAKMKEILFLVTINEHMQLIKKTPTSLEAHASLANAYVALASLYREGGVKEKFHATSLKAVQEYKIMNYYAPNDPWILAQLAACYHNLEMFTEEIQQFENILKLCPNDREIMLRLGILYFQQGENARGLQIYEDLINLNFTRADELIEYYDSNIKREYHISSL